ncbi:MAG: NfeD family protein [Streptosporangiales bacterium]|nr:NfeD family protein [Streptosporangiales bacterium]
MQAWIIWLIVAAGLGIAELLTLTVDLGLLAVAALAAGLVGAVGLGVGMQFVAFAATAVLTLGIIRPVVRRHLRRPPALRTGAAALIGAEAVVLAEVSKHGGRVRLVGEEWTARPYDSTLVIPEGATVDVFAIDGATALVHPRESP